MKARRTRILDDEEKRLQLELRLDNQPRPIKRALQDVCEHYEANRFFADPTEVIRPLILSHLSSKDVLVRRWSLKAIGLIGHSDDVQAIIDRLRLEGDREAQTWGTAALLKRAHNKGSLKELCVEARLDSDVPIVLASRLYAPDAWIEKHAGPVSVKLSDDELTLKWAIFLIGYGKAPDELFSPRFDNAVFLGELNNHDIPEISEYSIWALYERQDLSFDHCRIPLDRIQQLPSNVRKWMYRLAAKDPQLSKFDEDVLTDFYMSEQEASAREGLARAISQVNTEQFDAVTLEWYSREPDTSIKEILLAGLAARATAESDGAELVRSVFSREPIDSKLRRRLILSAQGKPLYRELQTVLHKEKESRTQPSLQLNNYGNGQIIMPGGNQNTINAGRDINAQNVAGGDIINNATQAVETLGADRNQDKVILLAVFDFLSKANLPAQETAPIYESVKAITDNPTAANRATLMEKLRKLGETVSSVAGGAEGLQQIFELISSAWPS